MLLRSGAATAFAVDVASELYQLVRRVDTCKGRPLVPHRAPQVAATATRRNETMRSGASLTRVAARVCCAVGKAQRAASCAAYGLQLLQKTNRVGLQPNQIGSWRLRVKRAYKHPPAMSLKQFQQLCIRGLRQFNAGRHCACWNCVWAVPPQCRCASRPPSAPASARRRDRRLGTPAAGLVCASGCSTSVRSCVMQETCR